MTTTDTQCGFCIEAVAEGMGDEEDIQIATTTVEIDGETRHVCGQCADLIAENAAMIAEREAD